MRKGLFLAFSALLFVLTSYLAHLWLSLLEGFPASFSPLPSGKLPPVQASQPLAEQVFFIFAERGAQIPEGGATFQVTWPEAPGPYTRYVLLLTGAPLEIAGVYFTPAPIRINHLLEAMAGAGLRVAFSGPGWWKELLGPSAASLYASFFASSDRYPAIISEGERFAAFFQPDFLFIHSLKEEVPVEEVAQSLGFNPSRDILAVLTPSSFVLWGKGVIPGQYGPISILDIAPTLAALAGSPVPASARGAPPLQAFLLTDELKAIKLVQVALQRVSLADSYLRETIGTGLDEGLKSDAVLAQNSLELGNPYGATDLARLTVKEADESMERARARAMAAGRWRRAPFFLLWVLLPPALLASGRRRFLPALIIAGLLSFTVNAWLFRKEWPYLSWEALAHAVPSAAAFRRTILSLYLPALLPLLWLLIDKERDLIEAGETLAGYGLLALYFTSLPVAFSYLMIGAVPARFFPPLGLYAAGFLGLWQLLLSGLAALPLPFLGMGIFAPLKLTGRINL